MWNLAFMTIVDLVQHLDAEMYFLSSGCYRMNKVRVLIFDVNTSILADVRLIIEPGNLYCMLARKNHSMIPLYFMSFL